MDSVTLAYDCVVYQTSKSPFFYLDLLQCFILFYSYEECTIFVYLKFIMYNVKLAHCRRVSCYVKTIFCTKWIML